VSTTRRRGGGWIGVQRRGMPGRPLGGPVARRRDRGSRAANAGASGDHCWRTCLPRRQRHGAWQQTGITRAKRADKHAGGGSATGGGVCRPNSIHGGHQEGRKEGHSRVADGRPGRALCMGPCRRHGQRLPCFPAREGNIHVSHRRHRHWSVRGCPREAADSSVDRPDALLAAPHWDAGAGTLTVSRDATAPTGAAGMGVGRCLDAAGGEKRRGGAAKDWRHGARPKQRLAHQH